MKRPAKIAKYDVVLEKKVFMGFYYNVDYCPLAVWTLFAPFIQ